MPKLFEKGHTPWHKGTKGLIKGNKGSFKKGHVPWIKNKKHTEKAIRKMKGKRGKFHSEEFRKRMSKRLKGIKFTEEHKRKMSKALKGRVHTKETLRKMSKANKGKHLSEEIRKKRSESMRGEKSRFWKGGVTSINHKIRGSLEYRLWREVIFKRDNYTCIWCGDDKGGNLEADHIKPFAFYPELRFAIDNGRTLCKSCHKTTETYLRNIKVT